MEKAQSFKIPKRIVWDAWQAVRANRGSAGIDGQGIQDFEKNEKDNLYKLWNRMSSGSYFPSPVKRVDIPKKSGGTRPLGIPTVQDRIAQMTARMVFEPMLEPRFHPDSYGYRPNKSALQALSATRKRCWEYDWVIDLDIKGFFDTIDHELMLKAVDHHSPSKWVRLYIERWLKSPAVDASGLVHERDKGTPQGGVISPLLANLFLHYAFDMWMKRHHSNNPFERYADDVVIHCRTRAEAESLLSEVTERLADCKLTVHPEKTKIVYCKDQNRTDNYSRIEFDFLGYTFRPRMVKNFEGRYFVGFTPAISRNSEQRIRDEMRTWKVHLKTDKDIEYLSRCFNAKLRGWMAYYRAFRPSALLRIFRSFHLMLVKWARKRYKSFRRSWKKAYQFLLGIARTKPKLFVYWERGWFVNDGI